MRLYTRGLPLPRGVLHEELLLPPVEWAKQGVPPVVFKNTEFLPPPVGYESKEPFPSPVGLSHSESFPPLEGHTGEDNPRDCLKVL